jgi:hypothetical protein
MQTRELIHDIVESQLRDGKPPETQRTLDRLVAAGTPRPEAVRLIALVMAREVYEMVDKGREFDEELYAERLNALPALPNSP